MQKIRCLLRAELKKFYFLFSDELLGLISIKESLSIEDEERLLNSLENLSVDIMDGDRSKKNDPEVRSKNFRIPKKPGQPEYSYSSPLQHMDTSISGRISGQSDGLSGQRDRLSRDFRDTSGENRNDNRKRKWKNNERQNYKRSRDEEKYSTNDESEICEYKLSFFCAYLVFLWQIF